MPGRIKKNVVNPYTLTKDILDFYKRQFKEPYIWNFPTYIKTR